MPLANRLVEVADGEHCWPVAAAAAAAATGGVGEGDGDVGEATDLEKTAKTTYLLTDQRKPAAGLSPLASKTISL